MTQVYMDEQVKKAKNDIHEAYLNVKDKVEDVVDSTLAFVICHPEEAAAIAGFMLFVARKADKYLDIYRENKLRESMIYDRSLGMYWETKKPLTTNQRLMIESRHKNGESYGSILSDMKLLKK